MTRRSHNFWLTFALLAGLLLASAHGCRCSSDEEQRAEDESPTAALPDDYPMAVQSTAPAIAERLPTDVDSVVFVSSYAAVVDVIEQMKSWGLVDPEQVTGIFASLERYHGINPGSARSWQDNGFPLTDGFAIGLIGGKSFFVVTPVDDREAFEEFVDVFINQEFGRPRTHEQEHNGVTLTRINVLKRDLGTIAYRDGLAYLVAGERLIAEAPASDDVLKRLLDVEPSDSLGSTDIFANMLELNGRGPVFGFTLQPYIARTLLAMAAGDDEEMQKSLESAVVDGLEAFSMGLELDDRRITVRSRTGLKSDQAASLLPMMTPDPPETGGIQRFLTEDVTGIVRLAFSPKNVESAVVGLLDEKVQKTWSKIKDNASVRLLLDFEAEVLYNLSGHALFTHFSFDQQTLDSGAGDNTDLIEATNGVLYLTFTDPAKSNGYFGKINLLKDLVPKKLVQFEERDDGVLVAVVKQKREALLRVAYHDGVLAVIMGSADVDAAIARMKSKPGSGSPPSKIAGELMKSGPIWGVSVEMEQVISFLSARYEVIQVQISRFLAPLERASFILGFDEQGIGLDVIVEMRSGG